MSEIWYEAYNGPNTVKEVVVIKESKDFVVLESSPFRTKKLGGPWTYHKTWDEAYSELYAQAMAKRLQAESRLTEAVERVKTVERLKEGLRSQ